MKNRETRLNVQGLARREPLLMTTMVASENNTFVSIDLAAGEPTVSTHFSQDEMYKYATFDGVDKAPFYRDGRLYIDDIYLMVMSVSPIGHVKMQETFDAVWPAGTFADQWLADPEVIKKKLKTERQVHKMLALALGYGCGPKKMVKQCYEAGYELSFKDAKTFHRAYWQLFSGLKRFSDRCAREVETNGVIINPFGYRGKCEPHKAFNFFIQSSVSGIMHVYLAELAELAPYMHLVTIIHDELLVEVPKVRLEEFRKHKEEATMNLNKYLGWTVAIRTGFAVGDSLYEAK